MSEGLGKDHPLVQRAADVVMQALTGIPEKDRAYVLEGASKLSQLEKAQAKAHEDAIKASEAWVEQVKKDQEVSLAKRGEPVKAEPEKKEAKK